MSLSQATLDTIVEVVGDKLCDEEVFTALNVSREVQKRGIRERHRNMRDEIHSVIASTNVYHQKTLVRLDSGQDVWVYHLPEDDPKDHLDQIQIDSAPKKPRIQPQQQAQISNANGGISPDARSRICIPSKYTQQLGLRVGDLVRVSACPSLEIVKIDTMANSNLSSGRTYSVDKSGNIRVARRLLKKAGIADVNVCVSVINGSIVIEEA
jgi:DNA-binding transcriptional regulator/RsmH inhibitor MraZ